MPNLLSRSKHKNSSRTQHCRSEIRRKEEQKRQENEALQISQLAKIFTRCEIFVRCEISHPAFVIFGLFDFRLTHFLHFYLFYPSCIMGIEGIFVFFFLI